MQYFFPNFHYGPIIPALIFSALLGLISYLIVFRTSLFDGLIKEPIVSNFLAVPTTMFALVMAFMASSAWQNMSVAKTSIWNEKLAIETISNLAIYPPSLKTLTMNDLKLYLDSVTQKEWGLYFNQKSVPEVEGAIRKLGADAWSLEEAYCEGKASDARCSASVITSTFLRALEQLRLGREQRLSLGSLANFGYGVKWVAVYLLAVVAAVNLAAGHRTSKHAAVIVLIIFCSCAAILFSIVALHIHPYKGPDALSPLLIAPGAI